MKKGNLLIVDDEVMILKTLRFNLEDCADNVFTAENGLLALEVLKENEINCVICDINMPKMNGLDLIKKIRSDGNDVPFIFFTAHGSQELMMEVVKYGAFDFLNKPTLDGVEDVVIRGLRHGLNGEHDNGDVDDSSLSEYQKLLDELK